MQRFFTSSFVLFSVILLLFLSACRNDAPPQSAETAVARVNGIYLYASDVAIHMAHIEEQMEWEYFLMYQEWEIDPTREYPGGSTFGRVMREEAVRAAAFYTVFNEYARGLGIVLMPHEQEMIDTEIARLNEQFGEEEFRRMLRGDGFRDSDHLAELYASQLMLDSLINSLLLNPIEFARFEPYLPPEETVPELLGAKHILAMFINFDSDEEAYDYAYALLQRVRDGEDFITLMHEHGQDPGMWDFPNGYSFGSGEMVPEFEEATRELAMGEVSGLVKSSFGYHIIMRTQPNEMDWHMLNRTQPQSMQDRMVEAIFIGLQNMVDEAVIEFLPGLDEM
jgi:hypothetical protein